MKVSHRSPILLQQQHSTFGHVPDPAIRTERFLWAE